MSVDKMAERLCLFCMSSFDKEAGVLSRNGWPMLKLMALQIKMQRLWGETNSMGCPHGEVPLLPFNFFSLSLSPDGWQMYGAFPEAPSHIIYFLWGCVCLICS